MKKQTRSILQELNTLSITNDKDRLIESTASNIINSSINLINLINREYDSATANELERRFLNSIKSGDPKKFKRGIQKVLESKK
tara:strand:+ start:168 stop:419 length:252 start_codon:yes stop_codon:yes gene_type:complete